MPAINPFISTFRLADENGIITTEFKAYLDQILTRIGGINGGFYSQLSYAATINWDLDQKPVAVVVMTGNPTIANPTNQVAGPLMLYRLTLVQDATGSRTVTWGSAYKFPGGIAPVLSTAANAVDELIFDSDGTNMRLVGFAKDIR
jgi:hypothetical protein